MLFFANGHHLGLATVYDWSEPFSLLTYLIGYYLIGINIYILWRKDWQLEVDVSQSHAFLYKINPLSEFNFDRNCIESFDSVNEYGVGVDIDPVLKFGKHVVCIVAKVFHRIDMLFRGSVFHNWEILRKVCVYYLY